MTAHGVLCGCDVCWVTEDLDDDRDGKAIARAAEVDHISDCD
ncbi:hypothetical protein NYQ35_15920 [Curtobacterium flaccumfaciens pv. flaccumfaciens]|nr:hypothetical protein [Curtobacterium flaccumfaciens]MCS6570293.1 hypothetical protein [Curtobacterium flaccumfaciens pv. flaccumfaciens]MCS6585149.1 hypothetical protein [Curtobacterium flaccumfaciens pv. flaccumfaciens]